MRSSPKKDFEVRRGFEAKQSYNNLIEEGKIKAKKIKALNSLKGQLGEVQFGKWTELHNIMRITIWKIKKEARKAASQNIIIASKIGIFRLALPRVEQKIKELKKEIENLDKNKPRRGADPAKIFKYSVRRNALFMQVLKVEDIKVQVQSAIKTMPKRAELSPSKRLEVVLDIEKRLRNLKVIK